MPQSGLRMTASTTRVTYACPALMLAGGCSRPPRRARPTSPPAASPLRRVEEAAHGCTLRVWPSRRTVVNDGSGFQMSGVCALCGRACRSASPSTQSGWSPLCDVVAPAHVCAVQQVGEVGPRVVAVRRQAPSRARRRQAAAGGQRARHRRVVQLEPHSRGAARRARRGSARPPQPRPDVSPRPLPTPAIWLVWKPLSSSSFTQLAGRRRGCSAPTSRRPGTGAPGRLHDASARTCGPASMKSCAQRQ